MHIPVHALLVFIQTVIFGSQITNDIPVAARMLSDGCCGLLIQSNVAECPATYEIALVVPGGSKTVTPIETGIDYPVWARGSGWTSDGMLSLILSSYPTGHKFADIVNFTADGELSESIRLRESGQPLSAEGQFYMINSSLPCEDNSGYWMTTDLVHSEETYEVLSKTLFRLGTQGDTLWSSNIPCPEYCMNPDVIRPMPDGGCVVGSDEDNMNETLYLSRLSSEGELLWSTEIETGSDIIHSVEDILPAHNGGTLVVASSDCRTQYNCLICLIDRNGDIVNRVFEAGFGHAVCTCGLTIEGGYLLTGWTGPVVEDRTQPVEENIFLLRLDENGTPVSMNSIPSEDNLTRNPCFLLETPEGYLVVGNCWEDYWLQSDVFTMLIPEGEIPSLR